MTTTIKYTKPIHILNMTLIQIKKSNFYDIFFGLGWKNHKRISFFENKVSVVEGSDLTQIQKIAIAKTLGERHA